ncbi:hypothetical protein T01_6446 [Trichinella spiralis]|uniref:Uncharacterized protein n=1 Tax=Trichinella spiralis TaxID=6334 RepID=A0A0V1BBV8_TRISP|nr:hypothetical protein T01_6446 [Trichinella spiralis]
MKFAIFEIHLGNQKGTSWVSIDQKRLELHNKDIHDVIVCVVLEIYAKIHGSPEIAFKIFHCSKASFCAGCGDWVNGENP